MADTLTPQELTALQEMPSAPEMGELRKITTLQDIPLAEGDNLQQFDSPSATDNETERKLKTNSLKRFFRLSPKKKMGDVPLEAQTSHMEFEEGACIQNKIQQNPITHESVNESNVVLENDSKTYQRYKIGLGLYESNSSRVNHRENQLTASFSKATLKSSLSTYWNSVFKQKKTRKSSKSHIELAEQELKETTTTTTTNNNLENQIINSYKEHTAADIEDNPQDNSILDDVHKLKISEESLQK